MISFILRLLLILACFTSTRSGRVVGLNGLYNHNIEQIKRTFLFLDNNLTVDDVDHNSYPLELGKALGFMSNQLKWEVENHLKFCSNCSDTPTIIFKQPQDMFFIWNNLQRPLPAPRSDGYLQNGLKKFPDTNQGSQTDNLNSEQGQTPPENQGVGAQNSSSEKITVKILNKQAALNQIALLSSQQQNIKTGEEIIAIHNFQEQTIIFPLYSDEKKEKTTEQYLREHILNANNSLSSLSVDEKIANNITLAIDEFLKFLTDGGEDQGLKGSVVYSDTHVFVDPNSASAYIPYLKEDLLTQLNPEGEVIYAQSDESFTLWLSDDRTKAYLIDAGSLFLSLGLNALVQNSETVTQIHATVTHFHLDHTQTLAPFIIKSASETTTVHLYIPDGLLKGFVGWFIQFNVEMAPLIDSGTLLIHFVDDKNVFDFGEYKTKFAYSWRFDPEDMNHVLPNVSPILNFTNNKYMIVAGDLTPFFFNLKDQKSFFRKGFKRYENETHDPYTPTFFYTVVDWVESMIKFAEIQENSSVDLYFYTGMFTGALNFDGDSKDQTEGSKTENIPLDETKENMTYKVPTENISLNTTTEFYEFVKNAISEDGVKLSMIETHVKDANFNCRLHKSFS